MLFLDDIKVKGLYSNYPFSCHQELISQMWPVRRLSEWVSANKVALFSAELSNIELNAMIYSLTHAFFTYSNVVLLIIVISLSSLTFSPLISCNIA
jgi:hypothetical protein